MTRPLSLRRDALSLVRAALDAADAGTLVSHALADPGVGGMLGKNPCSMIAFGKAAPEMAVALARALPGRIDSGLVVGTTLRVHLPETVRWFEGGHPVPNEASEEAGRGALSLAGAMRPDSVLVVLISGGGSALLAAPAAGLSLDSKRAATRRLLLEGADIHALNTVRKHLSAVKGGRLAASASCPTLALAISDVFDDDLSVIASGPTVPDSSRFEDALAVLDRFGGRDSYPRDAVAVLEQGARGLVPETPKPGDPRLARSAARVIGSRRTVLDGVRRSAEASGYDVRVLDQPVIGEARAAAPPHVAAMLRAADGCRRPACVISGGETTVQVRGRGRGGRNQEFALAAMAAVAAAPGAVTLASVGTDGVDGPTDAAGALVDSTSAGRAAALGLSPEAFLDENDSYAFFQSLGDLVITGPTGTNVGDLQILLLDAAPAGEDARRLFPITDAG